MSDLQTDIMLGKAADRLKKQADRIEALEAALREADTACFKLCTNHGFATGHGDTVAAMIEEIDAQISARAALDEDTGK